MALPTSFNKVTIVETYIDFSGQAGVGTVLFEPIISTPSESRGSGFLKSLDTNILIVPKSVTASLDQNGSISVQLPYSNDPDVMPQFKYHVTEEISGLKREYDITVDAELPGPVWLSDLAPVGMIAPGSTALTKELADQYYAPLSAGSISLGDGSVTTEKLGDLAVTGPKLAAGSVDSTKIATSGVATDNIAPLAVTGSKLADTSITEGKYSPASIPTTALKDGAVTGAKIADATITSTNLADGAVGTNQLANTSVTNGKLGDGSVNTTKLATSAVNTINIGNLQVTTAKIADLNVTTGKLADGAVDSTKLGTAAVTTVKLGDAQVTGAKIADATIPASKLIDTYMVQPASLTKGDLFVYNGSSIVRLPVGTNGYVLSANSSTGTGLNWIPAPSGGGGGTSPLITPDQFGGKGDVIVCQASISSTASQNVATISGYTLSSADVGKLIAIGMEHTGDCANATGGYLGQIASVNTATNTATIGVVGTPATARNATATVTAARTVIFTDDKAAINAAEAYLQGLGTGDGKIIGREGAFYGINKSILAKDGISYEFHGTARYDGTPHHIYRTFVAPGFIHGNALDTTNANCYPYAAANDIVEMSTTIVPTTPADTFWSSLNVGDVIGIRSVQAQTIASVTKVPYLLYFSRISKINTARTQFTMEDPAPFNISASFGGGVYVFRPDVRSKTLLGADTWIVQRGGLRNCIVDARHPVWGGGAYEWDIENIQNPTDLYWNEFVTLNSMSHCNIQDIPRAMFGYTSIEPKLGCGWINIRRIYTQWYSTGGSVYSPCSIGESTHNINFEEVDITLPSGFANSSMMFIEVYQSKKVKIKNNKFRHGGGALDAVISLNPTTLGDAYAVDGLEILGNEMIVGASGTTGCARVLKLSQVSSGSEAGQTRHKNVVIDGNIIRGTLRTDVNEWLSAQCIEGLSIGKNNQILIPGAQAMLGGYISGLYDMGTYQGSDGMAITPRYTMGYFDYTNTTANAGAKTFGQILPNRAFIISVTVVITTTFDGTGTNTIDIGSNAAGSAFVANVPANATGTFKYEAGQALPTAGGSYGVSLGQRFGGMLVTSQRKPQALYKGTSPTQGKGFVLIEYLPGTPDR